MSFRKWSILLPTAVSQAAHTKTITLPQKEQQKKVEKHLRKKYKKEKEVVRAQKGCSARGTGAGPWQGEMSLPTCLTLHPT